MSVFKHNPQPSDKWTKNFHYLCRLKSHRFIQNESHKSFIYLTRGNALSPGIGNLNNLQTITPRNTGTRKRNS